MDKFCSFCGTKAIEDSKFCESCGKPLEEGVTATVTEVSQSPYTAPAQPAYPSYPVPAPLTTEETEYRLWIQRGRISNTTCNIIMLIGFFIPFLLIYVYYRAGKGMYGALAFIGYIVAYFVGLFTYYIPTIIVYALIWYYIYTVVKGHNERYMREYGLQAGVPLQ